MTGEDSGSVPAAAPLEMPVRGVGERVPSIPGRPTGFGTFVARMVAFGGAAALTAYASFHMWLAVSVGKTSSLQYLLLVLFTVTFSWIAFSATSALAGLVAPNRRPRTADDAALPERTALVMPLYNEEVSPSFASLLAMAEGLAARGVGDRFELFVLSDSNQPDAFARETAAFARLRARLGGRVRAWYRRRNDNVGRKAGNVGEFVRRFGGRYEAMVMLDADSVMDPDVLIAIAREMAADPRLGILQTVPRLVGGVGPIARMQQFASWAYGPIVGRGIAAWQGDDGNYWGHNAILRVRAFAAACGLPTLRGRSPFGGSILSHDFVEAAWMRRAGYAVRMAPELDGSWEDSPPTLLDIATRDRRWAQGNLQHSGVVGARGLRWSNRAHFVIGIFSYLASPMWLALMSVGLALAVVATVTDPVYFSTPNQLFPDWPRFDAARMLWLFVGSMGLLVLPKLLGLTLALRSERGGRALRLFGSGVAELVVSSCYAPILMLMQTRQIWEILRGKDSGWKTQRRGTAANPWSEVVSRHWFHTVVGAGLLVTTWLTVRELAGWMAPTIVGLLLAIPLSRLSGSAAVGAWLRRTGWFTTPEERQLPDVLRARDEGVAVFAEAAGVDATSVLCTPSLARTHFAGVARTEPAERGRPDAARLVAAAKVGQAVSQEEALGWLEARELLAIMGDRGLYDRFAELAEADGAVGIEREVVGPDAQIQGACSPD